MIDFINSSTSPFHIVKNCSDLLDKAGFKKIDFAAPFKLDNGSRYYTIPYGTTLFAFTTAEDVSPDCTLRMASAHTDYPCFRIKPNPEIEQNGYMQLNIEAYGGIILNTWLDRPLSIAGKVCLKSDDVFAPKTVLFDAKKSLLTIPNLAIHINRDVNKGVELNKQTDIAPIIGMLTDTLDKDNFFMNYLADKLNVKPDEILDFDLYIYNCEEGCTLGMNDEFISSPRLDNLTSVYALVEGLIDSSKSNHSYINFIALYDNEEIGSRSKQGADSIISTIALEKIYDSFKLTKTDLYNSIMKSIHLSVDVAHCLHPNYVKKNDPTNITSLNNGVVIKLDSTQKYASDTEAISIVLQLCTKYDIACQKFTNRSDSTSGSTLGSIASSWLPMKTIDLGVPLLAMHSARELMGIKDEEALVNLMKAFFNE